jgi:hypothetical protein
MVNFDYIGKTEKIFSKRNERDLNIDKGLVEKFDAHSGLNFYLVLTTELSRKILLSKSFVSYDYFSKGIEKYISKGEKSYVGEFFKYSAIFQEGKQHLEQRKNTFRILDELNSQLIEQQDNLYKFIKSRSSKIKNQLDFSTNVTIFCLLFLIKQLLNISNKQVIKSILLRNNVWKPYFDRKKFLNLEKSLSILSPKFLSEFNQDDEQLKLLLSQTFIVMGYDPLVATICASTSKNELPVSFAKDVMHVCPTSYTTRICKEEIVLNGTKFTKGSILTLSLIPTKNEKKNIAEDSLATKSLSFGLGHHMCIGKKNSFVILNMAEKVWADVKKDIPIKDLTICPDGSFLAYKV